MTQKYFYELKNPNDARMIFRIHADIYDFKASRRYQYGSDLACRLCSKCVEDVDHVINKCELIDNNKKINIYSNEIEVINEIVKRTKQFTNKVEELQHTTS